MNRTAMQDPARNILLFAERLRNKGGMINAGANKAAQPGVAASSSASKPHKKRISAQKIQGFVRSKKCPSTPVNPPAGHARRRAAVRLREIKR
jgi:hypothetical protein